jgi:hypothetical protein
MIRANVRDGAMLMMPVARYFVFVGGALLALLFAFGSDAPKQPVVSSAAAIANPEIPGLRIRSDRKWPEAVVFDTSRPTITPAPTALAASVPVPTAVAEFTPKARVRESFAQFAPPEPTKPESKPQHKRKIVVRNQTAQPTMFAAQQPRFGLF